LILFYVNFRDCLLYSNVSAHASAVLNCIVARASGSAYSRLSKQFDFAFLGRFYRCVRCPAAYHTDDLCVAAGCTQLGHNSIVCSRHFEPEVSSKGRYHTRVNVGWCFQCSKGWYRIKLLLSD
jgi:hypothetical protein